MASQGVSDITPLLVQTFLFGAYTCVILISTWLIVRKGFEQKANIAMLVTTLVMYAAAASLWGVSSSRIQCAIKDSCIAVGTTQTVILAALLSVNFILSDSVVLWRAWLLWEPRALIIVISAILMGATLICAIGHSVLLPKDDLSWDYALNDQIKSSYFGIIEMFLSFTSNLFATGLIGLRAWHVLHRVMLKKLLISESNTSKVEKILAILTESGGIYCIVWLFYIISHFSLLAGSNLTVPLAMACVSGLYPTVIITLVHLQKTHCARSFSWDISEKSAGARASMLIFRGSAATTDSSTVISEPTEDERGHRKEARKPLAFV